MKPIEFQPLIYGFAAESAGSEEHPATKLNVCFPDMFPDKPKSGISNIKVNMGSKKRALINTNPPQISTYVQCRNYMTLPCIRGMIVNKGDRLICAFVDANPERGHVIGVA